MTIFISRGEDLAMETYVGSIKESQISIVTFPANSPWKSLFRGNDQYVKFLESPLFVSSSQDVFTQCEPNMFVKSA